jgi:hypothetical protein
LFEVFVQKFPKNAYCEDFLTKFVIISITMHGVAILQEAKNTGLKITASMKKYLQPDEKK